MTADECLQALQGMANGKNPGHDGLPKEFYVHFWPVLGSDLADTLNHAYNSLLLSWSQHGGIITLIHKKGLGYLRKNWRPVSLLCTDYKIASCAIACRLCNVIASVISPDQTCSIPVASSVKTFVC